MVTEVDPKHEAKYPLRKNIDFCIRLFLEGIEDTDDECNIIDEIRESLCYDDSTYPWMINRVYTLALDVGKIPKGRRIIGSLFTKELIETDYHYASDLGVRYKVLKHLGMYKSAELYARLVRKKGEVYHITGVREDTITEEEFFNEFEKELEELTGEQNDKRHYEEDRRGAAA